MQERIPVTVHARDPISRAGVASQLRHRPELLLVEGDERMAARVAVIVTDEVDDDAIRTLRAMQRSSCPRLVVVATRLDDAALLAAVEIGVHGLLRRREASPERLVASIQAAAAGDGTVPPDLLGRLLAQVGRLQREVLSPRGLAFSGLTDRETNVLRLVADGYDTSEIADQLAWSERTVKNIIHDITSRHQLRNRSHAVAYAVRAGLI
jgi:DNA-binding NarL/FixJ family response regulator